MKKLTKMLAALILMVLISIGFTMNSFATTYYYENIDSGDGNYCGIEYTLDYENKKAIITGYSSSYTNRVAIPETIRKYDYDTESYRNYSVTEIAGYIDCEYVDCIRIPKTVVKIGEYGVGYTSYYEYDYEYDDYVKVYEKIVDFTIEGTLGSYAQVYAEENGFDFVEVKTIDDLSISFASSSFTYTGNRIEPKLIIKDGNILLKENEDYILDYDDNVNAGTATVYIETMGKYTGSTSLQFKINPAPASKIIVKGIENRPYEGSQIYQWFDVEYNGMWVSSEYYTVKYRNNIYPGKAYVDITFHGNYTGTKTVSFNIYVPAVSEFSADAYSSSSIRLSWNDYAGIGCYYIYRYDASKKDYVYIGKSTYEYYYDSGLKQYSKYSYKVVAVVKDKNNKTYKSASVKKDCTTLLKSPIPVVTTYKSSIALKWSKNTVADGYIIYRRRVDKNEEYKKLKTVSDKNTVSYTDKSIKTSGIYNYYICSYKKVGNKTIYGEVSDNASTNSPSAILRGANLTPKKSFKVYNKQGKNTTSYTYNLSDNDIKLLEKFAKNHFKSDMTNAEKLHYTLNWINTKVTYALNDDWKKISGKSWVEAIFKYKLGQCAQYNGAMAAMMVYMGYDAYVIQGYRGSYSGNHWQHFWCEVKIQGRVYLMEAGNYGRSGSWTYFLTPYTYTSGYLINTKPAEKVYSAATVSTVKLSKTSYTYDGKVKTPSVTVKNTDGETLKNGTDYTVKYSSGRKNVGQYTVTVTFKGRYSGKKTLTFKINPKGTSVSKLTTGGKKLTVKWTKQATQTTGYQIQYSTSSKMSKATTKTVSKNSTTSLTVKNLKKGKKYYVRIRTYKTVKINNKSTKFYSGWSKIKSIKVN